MHNKIIKRICGSLVLLSMVLGLLVFPDVMKAQTGSEKIYNAVKSAYGSEFPLTDANDINTDRENVFGGYSTILGVSAKLFSEYRAAKKSSSELEQICFICKAASETNVAKIKKKMKKFIKNESEGNANYFSSQGKKLMKNAKVGSSGLYVYMFVIDTNKNKKAVKAFKGAVA